MIKLLRVTEIMWIVIGVVSAYETYSLWNVDKQKAYIFAAFFFLSIFMFMLRRKARLRAEQRQNDNPQP